MTETQLEDLFRACDKTGTGKIGPDAFHELCAEFDICYSDSSAIFTDLDHDGDGQVSLDDFAWGFRDFLRSPLSRRESVLALENSIGKGHEPAAALELVQRRHSEARQAWAHLVAGVGEHNVNKFLNTSGRKLADLYRELRSVETNPHLVTHFEGALSCLLEDVKKLHDDNQKLEEMFNRERESHMNQLRGLEEELDAQVARVEAQARENARNKFEQEKRILVEKMESESMELQTRLRLFQKVNNVLSRNREKDKEMTEESELENRELRHMLADTKTNLALLRSEMAQLRSDYETKCQELSTQKETLAHYRNQTDHVHRQLTLLHEANTKLQDTNDSLLTVIDSGTRTPSCYSPTSSVDSEDQRKTKWIPSGLRTPSPGSILNETHFFTPIQLNTGNKYGIQRLIDDFDSGRSTMRDPVDLDSETKSVLDAARISDSEYQNISLEEYSPLSSMADRSASGRMSIISNAMSEMEPTGPPDRTYKIVFAGDAAVGKTCFIHRFCKGFFVVNLGSTLGVDFQVKTIRIDNKNIALQLWDTAGQERFRSMTKTYFRRADGVMLLYDVTNERSFLNVRQWIQAIDDVSEKRLPIYICGNKMDLRADALGQGITCIKTEQGEQMARDNGAVLLETSSKTGFNVPSAIIGLCREMLTREDVEVQTSALVVTKDVPTSKSCCKK